MTAPQSKLGSWHANLLTIQRRNCLLFVHDQTRLSVFIPALTKPDFAKITWFFGDALMNTLLKCGATPEQLDTAAAWLQPLAFVGGTDRSVLGTLNQLGQDIDHMLYVDSRSVAEMAGYALSASLAERPCHVKGQQDDVWPRDAFLELLDCLSAEVAPHAGQTDGQRPLSGSLSEPKADNVVTLDRFRK
nr:hypothetical protein [Bacterioplanes sanyensis]